MKQARPRDKAASRHGCWSQDEEFDMSKEKKRQREKNALERGTASVFDY